MLLQGYHARTAADVRAEGIKSIKNMVIREAVRFGQGYLYTEEEGISEAETCWEEGEAHTEWQEITSKKDSNEDITFELPDDAAALELDERDISDAVYNTYNGPKYYAAWTNAYKEARTYLYGTQETEPDAEAAYEFMLEEAERGNAYAMYDMGKIYTQGIFVEPDEEKAEKWYNRALSAMLAVNKERRMPVCNTISERCISMVLGQEKI